MSEVSLFLRFPQENWLVIWLRFPQEMDSGSDCRFPRSVAITTSHLHLIMSFCFSNSQVMWIIYHAWSLDCLLDTSWRWPPKTSFPGPSVSKKWKSSFEERGRKIPCRFKNTSYLFGVYTTCFCRAWQRTGNTYMWIFALNFQDIWTNSSITFRTCFRMHLPSMGIQNRICFLQKSFFSFHKSVFVLRLS